VDHASQSGLRPKTNRRDRLIQRALAQPTWARGWGDAVWWRRLAQPPPQGWSDAEATRTCQALTPPTDDPAPKALACEGRRRRPRPQEAHQRWRRLGAGRPGRAGTLEVLAWGSAHRVAQGGTALRLLWANASWHRSHAVRHGRRPHTQQGKRGAVGVRGVGCPLPSHSPWLTPLAPQGVQGKRAVAAADRLRSADELAARVSAYEGGQREAPLVMPKQVA
jgi:hypothetical protein